MVAPTPPGILSTPHSRVLHAFLHIVPQGLLPILGDCITCPIRDAGIQTRECLENSAVTRKGVHNAPSIPREDNLEHNWNFFTGPRTHSSGHDGVSHISAVHFYFTVLPLAAYGHMPFLPQTFELEDSKMGTRIGLLLSSVDVIWILEKDWGLTPGFRHQQNGQGDVN